MHVNRHTAKPVVFPWARRFLQNSHPGGQQGHKDAMRTHNREGLRKAGQQKGKPWVGGRRKWDYTGAVLLPGKRVEEITHVIRVEALAHASRHVEAALERAVPHHVWNVVAEEPQGPEPGEQHAGRAAFHSALHLRLSRDSAQLAAGWKELTGRFSMPHGGASAGAVREECFRDPAPIVLTEPAFGVTQNQLPPGARRSRATVVPRTAFFWRVSPWPWFPIGRRESFPGGSLD